MSAQAVIDALPSIAPSPTSLVFKKTHAQSYAAPNLWGVRIEDYNAMPTFDWYQVFNMAGFVLPPPPTKQEREAAKKARKRAEKEAQWAQWSASAGASSSSK